MHFVSTSVLKSEDGISFNKEEQIESEEVNRAKALNSRPSKPLYEQLQEQEAKKQEEYDSITRQLFAPPKALDEEDVEHLDAVAERQRQKESLKQAEEKAALEAFAAAQRSHAENLSLDASVLSTSREVEKEVSRSSSSSKNIKSNKSESTDRKGAGVISVSVKVKRRKSSTESAEIETKKRRKKSNPSPSLLVDYGDSDEESDDSG